MSGSTPRSSAADSAAAGARPPRKFMPDLGRPDGACRFCAKRITMKRNRYFCDATCQAGFERKAKALGRDHRFIAYLAETDDELVELERRRRRT